MHPSTLPEDIYRLLDDETDHQVNDDNIEWAGEIFKSVLRDNLRKREVRRGEDVLRFSSLGKRDRQLWYAANKPETAEKLPGKVKYKFLYGHMIEVLLLFLAKEAGHEITCEQKEVEVDGVFGHMDAKIDGILIDVKSASPYGYKKFEDLSYSFDDPFGYVQQLSGYAQAEGVTEAGFLVAEKVSGDICFAPLDPMLIAANPPSPRIEHLREVIADANPPARCYPDVPEGKSGNRKLSVGCSYCSFKDTCWADANGGKGLRKFFYSRGPVWLSEVKKEPKVDEA